MHPMDKIHWKPDRGRTVSFSGHRRIEPASQPTLFGGGGGCGPQDPAGTGGVEDARTVTRGAGTERYGAATGGNGTDSLWVTPGAGTAEDRAVYAGGKSGSVPGAVGARTATGGAGTERYGAAPGGNGAAGAGSAPGTGTAEARTVTSGGATASGYYSAAGPGSKSVIDPSGNRQGEVTAFQKEASGWPEDVTGPGPGGPAPELAAAGRYGMNGLDGNSAAEGIGGTTSVSYESVIREKLRLAIGQLVEEGFDTFICGMATGFDLMAGEAVCDFIESGAAVTLVAAIPFPGQADRFAPADRLLYERVLGYAAHTHTLCPSYRKECYHLRNDFLVAGASVLLCFYNGSPGGTRYTVRKALRAGLRIVNIF